MSTFNTQQGQSRTIRAAMLPGRQVAEQLPGRYHWEWLELGHECNLMGLAVSLIGQLL